MRFPDPTLLVLMGYDSVPTHIDIVFEGTLIVPVTANGDIPNGPYCACIIVMPRHETTPDDRFRMNAWITTSVLPHLMSGTAPVYV